MKIFGLKPLVATQIIIVLALLTLAAVSIYAIHTLSNAASDMEQGKDLVADILPPPLYVIEAQLVSYELLHTSDEERKPLLEKLKVLKEKYNQRNLYWEKSTLNTQLKRSLLGRQRHQADLFWEVVSERFIPAIQIGDITTAQATMPEMRGYYDAHRLEVDSTVYIANRHAENTQTILSKTSNRTKWLLAVVTVISCLVVLGFAIPTLNRLYHDLHQSEDRLHAIFEQAAVGVALIETGSGRFLRINQHYCDIVGLTWEEINQTTAQALTHADDLEAETNQWRLLTEGKINELTIEKRYLHKNGSVVWVSSTTSPLRRLGESQNSHIAVVQDITKRKHAEEENHKLNIELEQRVVERTAELAAKNREMETFTYSVSHDLKAPLRGIDGYGKLLLADHAGQLNEEGRFFVQTIRQATEQMGQLIDDLLAYSRIERRSMSITQVDPRLIAEKLVAERAEELHQSRIKTTININCSSVHAEPEGLSLALRNVLDNAMKFTRQVKEPRVDIGDSIQNNKCVLWVRDNGPGFDMQYHDRIFEIFHRLHRAEDYPGTGIGLAIVRKSMQRMHGRVWAKSEPGQGATFFLEIPTTEESA